MSVTEALLHTAQHGSGTKALTSPPKRRDLPHEPRGDERVRRARRKEQRLDPRQLVVHLGHLQLVLEVGHGAQALARSPCAPTGGDVDHERRHRARSRTVGSSAKHSRSISSRSASGEERLGLLRVAQRRRRRPGRRGATARSTTSRWPLCTGSKEPGKSAVVTELASERERRLARDHGDERTAVPVGTAGYAKPPAKLRRAERTRARRASDGEHLEQRHPVLEAVRAGHRAPGR